MSQFNWKELDINIPTNNGKDYTLHIKYLPCEIDNKTKTI